jgi:hypothetical protein
MSWLRKNLGLDGFDVFVHVGITCMFMFFVAMSNGPEELLPVITGFSLLVLAIRRRFALKAGGGMGLTTGEMAAERIAELEERVAELEAAQAEVAELAERLDFAERLLAQGGREPERIAPGGTP